MYTSTQTFTLNCTAGETGASYTARATAESIITQWDADNKALGMAKALAVEFIECSFGDIVVTIYYNVSKTALAYNDVGYQTDTFAVTLPAGSVYSTVSQADADAGAQAAAQYLANEKRDLEQIPIFWNTAQSWSGSCPGGLGSYSVTITIPANTVSSNESASDASQDALAEAQAQVAALLTTHCVVTYLSTVQTYTATCGGGLVGTPITVTNAAGTHSSTVSQAAANAASLAAATAAANAVLSCSAGFWNVFQTYTATCVGTYGFNWIGSNSTGNVPAHSYFSVVSQAEADGIALGQAQAIAVQGLSCVWGGGYEP